MELSTSSNTMIANIDFEQANAEEYYFISHDIRTNFLLTSPDITARPLHTWGSVAFPALEFALWTHPKRIYLVGFDCALTGYFVQQNLPTNTTQAGYDYMYQGWLKMKKFIQAHYPDVEIISINPVKLQGLFKDQYTDQ